MPHLIVGRSTGVLLAEHLPRNGSAVQASAARLLCPGVYRTKQKGRPQRGRPGSDSAYWNASTGL